MKKPLKPLLFGLVGLLALVLLLNLLFPQRPARNLGSSFNRQPDGYGAWYAHMIEQDHPIQRLRQPYPQLPSDQNITVIQVHYPSAGELLEPQKDWVRQGNTLVILGINGSVTEARFRSEHETEFGSVLIETRRRRGARSHRTPLLQDEYGLMAWSEPLGEGQVLSVITPFLGANAYQDQQGNLRLLESWVTQAGGPIWIDEYIHGYRDPEQVADVPTTWLGYLSRSSLLPAGIQIGVILGIVIWAGNRRFGPALRPAVASPSNSETYIQALAAVLQKAHATEFVVDQIAKAERMHLQRSLGLGQEPVSSPRLLQAWAERTGKPTSDLEAVLKLMSISGRSVPGSSEAPRSISEAELQQWLQALHPIQIPTSGSSSTPPPANMVN